MLDNKGPACATEVSKGAGITVSRGQMNSSCAVTTLRASLGPDLGGSSSVSGLGCSIAGFCGTPPCAGKSGVLQSGNWQQEFEERFSMPTAMTSVFMPCQVKRESVLSQPCLTQVPPPPRQPPTPQGSR